MEESHLGNIYKCIKRKVAVNLCDFDSSSGKLDHAHVFSVTKTSSSIAAPFLKEIK